MFALRALPDPETLNHRIKGFQQLIQSKPLPFENVRLPIQKGYIRLPKLQKQHAFSTGYNYNRDDREDGENRSIGGVTFGPPLLPPVNSYPNSIDSVNPFQRYRFPYNPPTSSTVNPTVGFQTFDPQGIYDPATTTRSAPPTRGSSQSNDNFNLGLAPGPYVLISIL